MDTQPVLLTTTCVMVLIASLIFIGERTPRLVFLAKWLYYKPTMERLDKEVKRIADASETQAELQWVEKYRDIAVRYAAKNPDVREYEEEFLNEMRYEFTCFLIGVSTVPLQEKLHTVITKAAPAPLREQNKARLERLKEGTDVHRQNLIQCGFDINELVKEFESV